MRTGWCFAIKQWGQYTATASTERNISLPISFNTEIYFAFHLFDSNDANAYIGRTYTSNMSSIKCRQDMFGQANPSCIHYWFVGGE